MTVGHESRRPPESRLLREHLWQLSYVGGRSGLFSGCENEENPRQLERCERSQDSAPWITIRLLDAKGEQESPLRGEGRSAWVSGSLAPTWAALSEGPQHLQGGAFPGFPRVTSWCLGTLPMACDSPCASRRSTLSAHLRGSKAVPQEFVVRGMKGRSGRRSGPRSQCLGAGPSENRKQEKADVLGRWPSRGRGRQGEEEHGCRKRRHGHPPSLPLRCLVHLVLTSRSRDA